MRTSIFVLVALTGCGGGVVVTDAGELPVDAGTAFDAGVVEDAGTVEDAGVVADAGMSDAGCTGPQLMALEDQMRAALQATVTDHSFFLELRRPGVDARVFTHARNIDGVVDETTTTQSASTAKMITASVILDVVSNPQRYPGTGPKLTLDSFARDFLPDGAGGTFWKTETGALPTTNRLYGATLRQLLSFTSGLELESLPGGQQCLGVPAATSSHGACITRMVTVNAPRNVNAAEPRTFFYSGAHLSAAALMATNAAGYASWGELFKKYKELHGVFSGAVNPLAAAAVAGPGAFYPFSDVGGSPNPAGAMRYRAGDYAAFLVKLHAGQIVAAPTLAEMLSDQTVGLAIEFSPLSNDTPMEEWHYGLGLWNECYASTWTPACASERFSSAGSFGSYPFIDFNRGSPLIGFLARGGSDPGTGMKGVQAYRSLIINGKDLAQQWAANRCN